MTSSRFAELRARQALDAAGLDPESELFSVESVTNEVFSTTDAVVRVNRRIADRLQREATLGPRLPEILGYPEVLAYGSVVGHDWLVCRRRPGLPLVRCWPALSRDERRSAVRQLAAALEALHRTPAPADLLDLDEPPHLLGAGDGAVEPLLAALEQARELRHVDSGVIDEAAARVRAMLPALGDFTSPNLIHGDLHFQNVLWDGERITAVLDFEYARPAPADLDLDVLLRFCAFPVLFVPEQREAEVRPEDYEAVPWWFGDDYPELFSHPHALERLRIFALAFDVRLLLESPPTRPAADLMRTHPYRRIVATVWNKSYLDILADPANRMS